MQVPEFIKEVVWSFYPPRYRQIADKKFSHSLAYVSKVMLLAFLIAGLLFVPKLLMLKGDVQDELSKFSAFSVNFNAVQSDRINIPNYNPWVVIDLNNNVNMTKELFVIDKSSFQYRFISPSSIPLEQLLKPTEYVPRVSGFLTVLLVMLLPGIALLLYIRAWFKYLLTVLVIGTLFFVVMELSKFRLKWKQMLNICAHSLTLIILIETVSAVFTTAWLLPRFRFLGLSVYVVTVALLLVFMVIGVVGYHIDDRRKK